MPVFQGYRPVGVNGPPPADELAFQFGPWLVRVTLEGKTDAQRAIWARSLTGTTDANGYLLLHAAAPLSLGSGFDGGFGSQTLHDCRRTSGEPVPCGEPESGTDNERKPFVDGGGTPGCPWCDGDVHLSAIGHRDSSTWPARSASFERPHVTSTVADNDDDDTARLAGERSFGELRLGRSRLAPRIERRRRGNHRRWSDLARSGIARPSGLEHEDPLRRREPRVRGSARFSRPGNNPHDR